MGIDSSLRYSWSAVLHEHLGNALRIDSRPAENQSKNLGIVIQNSFQR
jgi:hypothetical protein